MLMHDFDYRLVRQFAIWKCDFPHFTPSQKLPPSLPKGDRHDPPIVNAKLRPSPTHDPHR
jgi:hypothetical protein